MTSTLRIDADHADAMADEQVRLTISGARPSGQIALHSRLSMGDGDLWESELVFEADEHGQVDLASAAPISGPYTDPHPMGFLWSMSQTKIPDHTPKPELSLAPPIRVDVGVRGDEGGHAELTLTRRYLAEGVTRTEVRDRGLIGTLFEPNVARPNPVVISLGGSEGGLNEPRAALLASHGFSSLALAYFGVGHLPPGLREVPLEYFQTAFDYLTTEGICDPGSIAIEGGSYGGELVLLLAARFPEVRCTIAHAPSGVLHSSVDVEGTTEATSAWSIDGRPLPFVQFGADAVDWTKPVISLAPGYRACLEHADDLGAATIEVENAVGPILMLSGADDQMWAS
ncbi:MAG: palmitoyl-CoA hydrolase, partial [Actinobacteria bacterium]